MTPRFGRLVARSLVGGLLLAFPQCALAADYGVAGPRAVVVEQVGKPSQIQGALAFPADVEQGTPIVLLAHGFASSSQRMIGWGEHIASHGFIALSFDNCVGDLLCGPDPAAQPGLVEAALAYLGGEMAPAQVRGKGDREHVLLLGHSAGGQAMTVAANALRPRALLLFDPVGGDQSPESVEPARASLSTTCATTLTLFAEPHAPADAGSPSCNKAGIWRSFALASAGPRASAVVVDSTHCDGELPPRAACGFSCGGRADEGRQQTYKRYLTTFALAVLRNDGDAADALNAGLTGDAALRDGRIEGGESCVGGGWPGMPRPAGGASGGSGAAGAPAADPPSSGGCAFGSDSASDRIWAACLGLVACVSFRRRAPSRSGPRGRRRTAATG